MMGTCNFLLPAAIELDPNLELTQADLRSWATRAAHAAADAQAPTGLGAALASTVIAAWLDGEYDLACLVSLLPELGARGLLPLALRAAIQISVDAEIADVAALIGRKGTAADPRSPA